MVSWICLRTRPRVVDQQQFLELGRLDAAEHGGGHDPSAVVEAHRRRSKHCSLRFRSGGSFLVSKMRRVRTGIEQHLPGGRRPSWPSLDVDVYVPGLLERAFGTRLFGRATGQRGGRRRRRPKPRFRWPHVATWWLLRTNQWHFIEPDIKFQLCRRVYRTSTSIASGHGLFQSRRGCNLLNRKFLFRQLGQWSSS